MKKTRIIGRMLLAMLALCIVTGCSDELDESRNDLQGKNTLQIKFETPEFNQLNTRVMGSDKAINDVAIVVIKNGVVNKVIPLSGENFTQAVTVNEVPDLPRATVDESGKLVENGNENLICFLANIDTLSGIVEGKSSYDDVKNYTATLTKEGLLNLEYIPMYGIYTDGIVKNVTNQINVSLTRALAKINFTVNLDNFTLANGEKVTPTVKNIVLRNVPLTVTFPGKSNRPSLPDNGKNGVWPEIHAPYPAMETTSFVNITKKEADEWSGNSNSKKLVAFMPENARGSYEEITTYEMKKDSTRWVGKSGAVEGVTCIELTLNYTTLEGVISDAVYKIFLGGNDKGDMNIRANAQYNITANIYGDKEGVNVEVTELFNLSKVTNSEGETLREIAQPTANSYMVDITEDKEPFYLNLMQARLGWSEIEAELKDGNTYVNDLDNLLRAGDWTIETLWSSQTGDDTTITGKQVGSEWNSRVRPNL